MFLIDTVTLSELRRRARDPKLLARFERQRTTDLFLSVVSIGEIAQLAQLGAGFSYFRGFCIA